MASVQRASLLFAPAVVLCCAVSGGALAPAKAEPASLNELSMEVGALQTLYQFDFTAAQRETLRRLARTTSQETGARQAARASAAFRKTLLELRAELAKGTDGDRISDLQDALEKHYDADELELDDGWEVSDEARDKAPEVLRTLSARQLVSVLSGYGDEFPDPLETLTEALEKARGLKPEEWKHLREDVAEQVSRLVAGLNVEKAVATSDQVIQLLIRARALKDEEFKAQRAELEKEARQIVGDRGPLEAVRHAVEYSLAELLSNPRLPAALDLCNRQEQPRKPHFSSTDQ
jgi:hypothetical protein